MPGPAGPRLAARPSSRRSGRNPATRDGHAARAPGRLAHHPQPALPCLLSWRWDFDPFGHLVAPRGHQRRPRKKLASWHQTKEVPMHMLDWNAYTVLVSGPRRRGQKRSITMKMITLALVAALI